MSTMFALVGEQPIPVWLPFKYLKPEKIFLIYTATTEKVAARLKQMILNSDSIRLSEAYDILEIEKEISRNFKIDNSWIFNITGATKPLSIAAFNLAREYEANTIYFQSEGGKSLLYEYCFKDKILSKKENSPIELPELITLDEYIQAHIGKYEVTGPHKDEKGKIDSGGKFEQEIFQTLQKNNIDALCGIRPKVANPQIEIDLIFRIGNNVGVAECKLSSGNEVRQKSAIEQLALETEREYFGIYKSKFLITAGKIDARLKAFAIDRKYYIIELNSYSFNEKLSEEDIRKIINVIREKLKMERN